MTVDVSVNKEIFFSSQFFVAIKSEKDYYNRFRASDEQFSPISSPLFRAMCSIFYQGWNGL